MRRRWGILGAIVAAALVGLLVIAIISSQPVVPTDAAMSAVARAVPSGDSTSAGECLPTIEDPAGVMGVCWESHRDAAEDDSEKDYYLLRVWSTFGGENGSGARWAVLRADLEGAPAEGVFSTWPNEDISGPCRQVDIDLQFLQEPHVEDVCGRTTGRDTDTWGHSTTWTCEGLCILPGHADRALSLYVAVGVPSGTIPAWDIFADLGG